MDLYLVRHTTPRIEKGICYGQSDIEVVQEFFEKEKNAIVSRLPSAIDLLVHSPLKRCHQLSHGITKIIPAKKIREDERLMEMNFGNWELKNWNEIDAGELDVWMKDFENAVVPGGESFQELNARVMQLLNELLIAGHQTVVIVSHSAPLRSIIANALEMPIKNIFRLPMDYGSVTKLTVDGNNCFSKIEYINNK